MPGNVDSRAISATSDLFDKLLNSVDLPHLASLLGFVAREINLEKAFSMNFLLKAKRRCRVANQYAGRECHIESDVALFYPRSLLCTSHPCLAINRLPALCK